MQVAEEHALDCSSTHLTNKVNLFLMDYGFKKSKNSGLLGFLK